MALFKIEKGLATNLLANRPNAVEGYCYFTTDDGKFYIDTKTGSLTGSNPTGTRVALNANYASKLLFGEITQSSSSTLKVSTINNLSSLIHGTIVVLKNNGSNTAANANLNINNLGSKPIYVNGNPITANTWRANEMAILFYDANSYSGTTGVWSLIPGVTYIHPQYTARTGVPTANQTPAFGGTFSVNQITSDSTGHVTAATSRTITIPSTLSNGTGTAGLIKTSSTVTSNSGYTACPVIDGVPYYKDTNTDTKNTTGSTDTSSKIFLIGATSQAANPQTYSHDTAYVGTDGCLYSNSTKVSVDGHTHDDRYYTETEVDNYQFITTSDIDEMCDIPKATITISSTAGNSRMVRIFISADISFEQAKLYLENFGILYVTVIDNIGYYSQFEDGCEIIYELLQEDDGANPWIKISPIHNLDENDYMVWQASGISLP